jgi:hypothetical protein
MNRREFLRLVALGAAGARLTRLPAARGDELMPGDKGMSPAVRAGLRARGARRVRRERFAIGMPIDGICGGQLYLLGDGTLGGWQSDGRCPESRLLGAYRPERELEQGFCSRSKACPRPSWPTSMPAAASTPSSSSASIRSRRFVTAAGAIRRSRSRCAPTAPTARSTRWIPGCPRPFSASGSPTTA